MEKTVKFCYRCGRRLEKERESCWYCGAPTEREIRPPRRCPFCSQSIPHDAVKCRHCGEWLDGRKQAPQAPSQIVYVIDKALLQAAQDCRLLAGRPVPPEIAGRLLPGTVQAIEHNQPQLIAQSGVRALPAPEPIDVALEPTPSQASGGGALVRGGATDLPARREDTPQSVALRIGGALGRALMALGRWLIKTAPGARPRPADSAIDAQVQDHYRTCENCGTEILASDSYCYHCGMQYHWTVADEKRARKRAYPSTLGLYVVVVLMLGMIAYMQIKVPVENRPPLVKEILSGLSLLFCAIGFFVRRRSVSQVIGIILALATVAVYLIL